MNKEIQNNIQTSKIFTRFKKIPDKAFHDFYFFYQFYLPQINALEFEEYIEIKYNYIQALFHLDKYQQFYKQSDDLITELLNYQNFESRSKIIYEQVVFLKAEALRNENKLQAAQTLYGELMRLNPANKLYQRKLFYLLFQNEQIRNRKNVAIIVLFILLSLICTGISIFVIQPFFMEWADVILIIRDIFFVCGVIGYIVLQGAQVRVAMRIISKISNKL